MALTSTAQPIRPSVAADEALLEYESFLVNTFLLMIQCLATEKDSELRVWEWG